MTDRLQNSANSAIGGAKQSIGNALGNSSLAAKGAAQKAHAETDQKATDAKTHAEGLGNTIQGNIQKTFGAAVGNHTLEAKGHANVARGEVQKNV
ncbi:hypothetical protein BGZ75_003819 [Mortierella antarctica]|nr:hypothetical protein BGZ67_007600 [Mortierella alpina]KAF9990050.1 hypothetical protein BGZ75_003819 [Mortierella antarctica]